MRAVLGHTVLNSTAAIRFRECLNVSFAALFSKCESQRINASQFQSKVQLKPLEHGLQIGDAFLYFVGSLLWQYKSKITLRMQRSQGLLQKYDLRFNDGNAVSSSQVDIGRLLVLRGDAER